MAVSNFQYIRKTAKTEDSNYLFFKFLVSQMKFSSMIVSMMIVDFLYLFNFRFETKHLLYFIMISLKTK